MQAKAVISVLNKKQCSEFFHKKSPKKLPAYRLGH